MSEIFSRTELLLGKTALDKLKNASVAVFGVGGVGGFTAEALARSGIGEIHLIDNDVVSLSNINRQIVATTKTIGQYKVDVLKERISDINSDCKVFTYKLFFMPETSDQIDFSKFNYVVDAVDTVTAKKEIILRAKEQNIPIISSMGAGNKLDPTAFLVADIYKTSVCPLARVMRTICRQNGIKDLKVVYSKEEAKAPTKKIVGENGKVMPGSVAFVPSVAGLIIAGEVIKDLIK